MIQFLYGQELVTLDDTEADTTVLEWLRLVARQTGTKEGCASGDCGACTVVVASLDASNKTLIYQSINSCIAFVGSLHGKQLISVEQLSEQGAVHPVQKAMVDCHGSQCGFCTPGFVMSMFAHFHSDATHRADPQQIEHALAGNLCRCTGYRPIKEAMQEALRSDSDQYHVGEAAVIAQLTRLQQTKATDPNFLIPESLDELLAIQNSHPDARLLAGGTDLALEVTQLHQPINQLIQLTSIAELNEVSHDGDQLTIGAAVSLGTILAILAPLLPGATQMLQRFGSTQIRNQATMGGNIGNASPIGDLPPLLLALDAQLELFGKEGERSLPIQDFYLDYKKTALKQNEIIKAVRFRVPSKHTRCAVYKVSKRIDDDISAVCLAALVQVKDDIVSDIRLAYGGMAATPKRAVRAEQVAIGKRWNEETIDDIKTSLSDDFSPLSDARASAEYRASIAANLITRFFLEDKLPSSQTQVVLHAS